MLTIVSVILIGLSLAVILAIIIKKFPTLAILDVHSMPGEKEAKFKEMLIKARMERDFSKWKQFAIKIFSKLNSFLAKSLKLAHDNLKKIKLSYKASEKMPMIEKNKQIKELLDEADELIKAEEYLKAEDKLVEVISLDQKNLVAFCELGGVYEELKKYSEARQTYEYALKLSKQLVKDDDDELEVDPQEIYFSLAYLEKEAGNYEAAFDNISEALELEPNSPRFLDLILDLSIIRKDKENAKRYLDRLAEVNPENNKLAEIAAEIEKL